MASPTYAVAPSPSSPSGKPSSPASSCGGSPGAGLGWLLGGAERECRASANAEAEPFAVQKHFSGPSASPYTSHTAATASQIPVEGSLDWQPFSGHFFQRLRPAFLNSTGLM